MDIFFRLFGIKVILLCVLPFGSDSLSGVHFEIPECEPPDFPESGGYGPVRPFYISGDFVTYHCDPEAFLIGEMTRKCDYTGSWAGDTPVCDFPQHIRNSNLSTKWTGDWYPSNDGVEALAHDSLRGTCLPSGHSLRWNLFGDFGQLDQDVYVHTIKIFGKWRKVPDEVSAYMENTLKVKVGEKDCSRINIPRDPYAKLGWADYNCSSNSEGERTPATGIYIEETDMYFYPFYICEIYVLTEPRTSCKDPHMLIANGRLEISRTTANLVCNAGYVRSPETRIECIAPNVWSRKQLYCSDDAD